MGFGEYIQLDILGQGGMGVVYLVEHAQTGLRGALKTLTAPEADLSAALRLEIRTLERLDHPGVVSVLEHGESEDVPWYVMELLGGATFGQLREGEGRGVDDTEIVDKTITSKELETMPLWTKRLPSVHQEVIEQALTAAQPALQRPAGILDQARTRRLLGYISQICHALAYTHGEGVVHCDLKPDNIFVTSSGRAVLVDFGLAGLTGRRIDPVALEAAGHRAGTAFYIAPERILGGDFDARADLYAIGCMLYEVLVGHPPFDKGGLHNILAGHLQGTPAAPSELGLTLPAEVEALIMSLLSKDARDRPGHAHAVVRVLEGLGLEGRPPSAALPTPSPYLYRPSLVGRDRLINGLDDLLNDVCQGSGGIFLVQGESGMGKTHLAMELIQRARNRMAAVLVGQCEAQGNQATALGAFSGALRRLSDQRQEPGREALTLSWPILAPYLPNPAERRPVAEEIPAQQARRMLFGALAEVLDELGRGGPVLFVIDDIQWADELSLSALAHLLEHRLHERPWLILLLGRAGDIGPELGELCDAERILEETLDAMDADDLGAMAAQMLGGAEAPETMLAPVVARSEGNPYYVVEYLHLAIERGLLSMDEAGHWVFTGADASGLSRLPVPASIQAISDERLGRLEPVLWEVCRAASVLGLTPDLGLLDALCGLPGDALAAALDALEQRQILVRDSASQVRFVRNTLRSVAYDRIPADQRAGLHLAAAETLATLPGQDAEGVVAWHWHQGGELVKAREAYTTAAHQAAARHDYAASSNLFQSAIDLVPSDQPALDITLRLDRISKARSPLGQVKEDEPLLRGLVARAGALGHDPTLAKALVALGIALSDQARYDEAYPLFKSARILYERLGDRQNQALNLAWHSDQLRIQGQFDEAIEMMEAGRELIASEGPTFVHARLTTGLAVACAQLARYDEALALYLEARAEAVAIGNDFQLNQILNNLGTLYQRRGHHALALGAYKEVIATARARGHRLQEGKTLTSAALSHFKLGELEEAMDVATDALAIHRALGSRYHEALTMRHMGIIQHRLGDNEAATALLEASKALFETFKIPVGFGNVLKDLGNIKRDLGEPDEAISNYKRALEIFEQLQDTRSKVQTLYEMGRALTIAGDPTSAMEVLQDARRLVIGLGNARLLAEIDEAIAAASSSQ